MAALDQAQRDAILRRHGALVQTYFSSAALRTARFEPPEGVPGDLEQELYDYLRLSSVLEHGRELVALLDRIVLAAAGQQVQRPEVSHAGLTGPLDPAGLARLRGRRTGVPAFPVRRIRTTFAVDENVLAAACAQGLLAELQRLLAAIPLPPSSERDLVAEVAQLLDMYLRDPALAEAAALGLPDVGSDAFDQLAASVAERWRARRIGNVAYRDLLDWARAFRTSSLPGGGAFAGLVYSEEFDDRLFELFVLGCVRDGLLSLGFEQVEIRPLHRAGDEPVLRLVHPDTGDGLGVFFQRATGVLWSDSVPRAWPTIGGVPDLVLRPDSLGHPAILVDAKSRRRRVRRDGDGGAAGGFRAAEEVYKMLGYFSNFESRVVVSGRGPVGGLVFLGDGDEGELVEHRSRSGEGLLVLDDWDPAADGLTEPGGAVERFIARMLEWAGLMGGRRPDGQDVRGELERAYGDVADGDAAPPPDDQADDPELIERLERVHRFAQERYWVERGPAVLGAEQALERHMLGAVWRQLTEEERRFLVTAEVFWHDHAGAIAMDFGPVVIELAKACESVAGRLVFEPFKAWAAQSGRKPGQVETIGAMRGELERAREIAAGGKPRGKGAEVLDDYLDLHGLRPATYGPLLQALTDINGPRRAAAHPYSITAAAAQAFRAKVLGVGGERPLLATLVESLADGP